MILHRSNFLSIGSIIFILIIHLDYTRLDAQDKFSYDPLQKDTLIVARTEISVITFPDCYRIMDQSIQVMLNRQPLQEHSGYNFNPATNQLFLYLVARPADSLKISFRIQPVLLRPAYSFFNLDTLKTVQTRQDSVVVIKSNIQNPFSDLGNQLQKSGSIVRGINVGTNRDLTLNSGLNLQLSGYITEDVEVVAALTDESTPIQPEGNTQTLNEVDRVFIQFKHPWLQGTLGDFNLEYGYGQFGTLSRKLQGISLTGKYHNYMAGATVASTRGFFNFMSFLGQEGNQGPYQLTGKNDEQQIIVLAGTERIWVDGVKMTRGENNDYIVDYSYGQLTFTNRRLITSASRIELDFEYYPATQKYTRNIYSGILESTYSAGKLNFNAMYYQEEDDPDKILEAEGILDQSQKDIITQAGDDPLQAYVSGVKEVPDSTGSYIKIDTLINNAAYVYYRYVGEGQGNYTVNFSSVGTNRGDYNRESLGIYRWTGVGRGSYLPIELLPLPIRHQLADFQLDYAPVKNIKISSEYAMSNLDRNTMSPDQDADNTGSAVHIGTRFSILPFAVAMQTQSRIDFMTLFRYVSPNFQPVDRINQIDYRRYWNILSPSEVTNEEKSLETTLRIYPFNDLRFNVNLGSLSREQFRSIRYQTQMDWVDPDWFKLNVNHEFVGSDQDSISNDWIRQDVQIEKALGHWQPGLKFRRENRKNDSAGILSGFDFNEWAVRMDFITHPVLTGFTQFVQREDKVYDPGVPGKLLPQATTQTVQLRLDLNEWQQTSGSLEIIRRNKNYTALFENTKIDSGNLQYIDVTVQDTVWQDRQTALAELILNHYQWERSFELRWQYRLSTEQLALREKVYLDVGEGNGNLKFDEQLGEYVPDPNGNYILYIIPSGQFEPVTSVETSFNLKLDPSRYWKKAKPGLQQALTMLTSESYLRIEEQSKQKNISDLVLLNISTYQGDQTVRGIILFTEDLYILRQSRKLSFRIRYQYRDDRFNQFLDPNENEDRLSVEKGLRANYQLNRTLKGQSELRNNSLYRNNKSDPLRNEDINSYLLNQNFSYRPLPVWEFGIDSEFGVEEDRAEEKNLLLRYARLLGRINYSLLQKGRLSAEYDWMNVTVINNPGQVAIPYEMARGKKEGLSKQWRFRGDYTVTDNIVVSVFYEGRKDATYQTIIHSGQAEVRAYF
jgi:hypothetical protein